MLVTLTSDISSSGTCISVSGADFKGLLTFSGGNHTITGNNTGYGIYLNGVYGLNVRDVTFQSFDYGVYMSNSSDNNFEGIYALSNDYSGIRMYSSSQNTFKNVVSNGNWHGFFIYSSNSNSFSDLEANNSDVYGLYLVNFYSNTFQNVSVKNSGESDVKVSASTTSGCLNTFTNVVVSRNKPLYYCNSACELNGLTDPNLQDASLIILCNADGSKVTHVNVCGAYCAGGPKNNGIYIIRTENTDVNDVNSSTNLYGIYLVDSNVTVSAETTNENSRHGIYMFYSTAVFDLTDQNSSSCGNASLDLYLYYSTLTCNCGSAYFYYRPGWVSTSHSTFTCDCNQLCP